MSDLDGCQVVTLLSVFHLPFIWTFGGVARSFNATSRPLKRKTHNICLWNFHNQYVHLFYFSRVLLSCSHVPAKGVAYSFLTHQTDRLIESNSSWEWSQYFLCSKNVLKMTMNKRQSQRENQAKNIDALQTPHYCICHHPTWTWKQWCRKLPVILSKLHFPAALAWPCGSIPSLHVGCLNWTEVSLSFLWRLVCIYMSVSHGKLDLYDVYMAQVVKMLLTPAGTERQVCPPRSQLT